MTLLVTVLLASVALRAEASPASPRFARDIISFDMVLPGVRDVPVKDDTTTEAPLLMETFRLPVSEDEAPILFVDSLPMFAKADKGPQTEMKHPEEAQPEEKLPEEAQPEENQPEEVQPEEAAPEEKQPKEVHPEEEVGSGVGHLLLFPTERNTSTAPKVTTEASEGFIFPSYISLAAETGEEEEESPNRSVRTEGECKYKTEVMFNGSCEQLLARSTCAKDEWLLLLEGVPQCARRPCPWGQVPFEDRCVDLANVTVCDSGQILYVDFSGKSLCDCEHGFLYDPLSGNCYARHEKGSCVYGEYLDVSASGMMECVRNPCISEGFVKEDATGLCYKKKYTGFCDKLVYHRSNRTAECLEVALHNILDVTELRECPPGSLRDYLNVCRETFPTLNSYPALYGGCPGGFVLDPRGTCRKASRLFG
ncbi:uncharacterized protein LOC122255357 [Penaeus japonicus]|uniref:uncharacterized protein LOC122255357 n=1 Tax=Penaeus japonicus TaxID=27405 RepID=UPI001C715554|nr:uncharacterized protein LOC122255357 [Penaeus japonicus]